MPSSRPLIRLAICLLNACRETTYIPPRAPSKPQFQAGKRLTIAKRRPNAEGTSTAKPFLSSDRGLCNQTGGAPVASATGIGKRAAQELALRCTQRETPRCSR